MGEVPILEGVSWVSVSKRSLTIKSIKSAWHVPTARSLSRQGLVGLWTKIISRFGLNVRMEMISIMTLGGALLRVSQMHDSATESFRNQQTAPLFRVLCFIRTQISLIKLGLAWSDPTPGFSSTRQFNRRRGNFQKLIRRSKYYPNRPVDGLFSHAI